MSEGAHTRLEPGWDDMTNLGGDNAHATGLPQVVYHNPLDNVSDLGHHFFKRCLEAEVTPYVVTKKTVFKWQEDFWLIMLDVYVGALVPNATTCHKWPRPWHGGVWGIFGGS